MNQIKNLKPNIIIGDTYEGVLILPAWKGFQSRQGTYCSKDKQEESDGLVNVFVSGSEVDYVKTTTQSQIDSIKYLINNSKEIKDAILMALLNEIPDLREHYEELIPEIIYIEDFKKCIGLGNLHIMNVDKDGFAYIGFEMGCDWDMEHGIGIMTHKNKVIAIGQAHTAFDVWEAYKDNGTYDYMTKKWDEDHKQLNRPWWKFW